MKKQADLTIEGNILKLSGDLDFSNVMPLYQQSLKLFTAAASHIQVDFAGVRSANSVALALMIDWMRLARKMAKTIQFDHVSQEMKSLASAAGLDTLLADAALYQ